MMANPGVGEGEFGLAGEKIDQARQVVPVPDVVRRQIGDEGAAAGIESGVQGATQALVGIEANAPHPWVVEERRQDGLGVVRRSIVDDDELPVGQRLGERLSIARRRNLACLKVGMMTLTRGGTETIRSDMGALG